MEDENANSVAVVPKDFEMTIKQSGGTTFHKTTYRNNHHDRHSDSYELLGLMELSRKLDKLEVATNEKQSGTTRSGHEMQYDDKQSRSYEHVITKRVSNGDNSNCGRPGYNKDSTTMVRRLGNSETYIGDSKQDKIQSGIKYDGYNYSCSTSVSKVEGYTKSGGNKDHCDGFDACVGFDDIDTSNGDGNVVYAHYNGSNDDDDAYYDSDSYDYEDGGDDASYDDGSDSNDDDKYYFDDGSDDDDINDSYDSRDGDDSSGVKDDASYDDHADYFSDMNDCDEFMCDVNSSDGGDLYDDDFDDFSDDAF